MFFKKVVLNNFTIFTWKHLCCSLFLVKLQFNFIKKRPHYRCFPVNIAKCFKNTLGVFLWILGNFSRTLFLKNICEQLLLAQSSGISLLSGCHIWQCFDQFLTKPIGTQWRWWWWIVFVVWLTDEWRLALFPAGTIVRDPHHRESPTRREHGLKLIV